MFYDQPEDAMPWVGLYTAIASLICTLAMAADVIQAFWQWKLWFPNKFFTLNAATITLIAIAMKLPVDLTTEMRMDEYQTIKMFGMAFLVTMLANFLPSLGLMDGRELLMNMVALGILVVTITVNIGIQFNTFSFLQVASPLIFSILWPFSVALTIPSIRKSLEHRYTEAQDLISCHQGNMFSFKELKRHVTKYWMITETCNPQFVIACSPVSSAFGVLCSILSLSAVSTFVYTVSNLTHTKFGTSDYKWSIKIIFLVQSVGIAIGSISSVFRCFTSIGHYSLSKKWSKNQLNVFRVEKHWIQMLKQWKGIHVHSQIQGRQCIIVLHNVNNIFLNLIIALHIAVLVICKTICLIPRAFLILLSYCWYSFNSILKKFKKVENASSSNISLELEDYTRYAVKNEDDAKLSNKILRNTLHSITQLLDESEKKEPCNLVKILEKSTGFNGVVKFHDDQVPPLYQEETPNSWSLVVVTLTSIAIAIPNIANGRLKGLLFGMREGLHFIEHIEECLNVDDGSIEARKAARRVWTEVEVYRTWLQIELRKKAKEGQTSKVILKWLGDEAAKIVIQMKGNKNLSIDQSYKYILASSMYKISQTILFQCNEQDNLSNDEELLEWISNFFFLTNKEDIYIHKNGLRERKA